jgi:hypothetical protein
LEAALADWGSTKRHDGASKEDEMSILQVTMIVIAVTMFGTAAYAQFQSAPAQPYQQPQLPP